MFKAFLVKYAEIGIKGKNRYLFEDALIRQMENVLKDVEGTSGSQKNREESMCRRKVNSIMMKHWTH